MEPLTQAQLDEALAKLDGWEGDITGIRKEFRFTDFRAAIAFVVRVGFEAEQRGHHPELENVYSRVVLTFRTHDAGDLVTQNDLDMAAACDRVA